jgi:VWFA-related protein
LLLGAFCPVLLAGQAEPKAVPQPVQAFGTETSRVVLDVVVRDDKERPVTDLEASDFEVSEDGVRQKVDLFRVVRPPAEAAVPPPEATGAKPAEKPPEPSPEATLIALVFDRLSPSGRNLAKKAALTCLDRRQPNDLIGVFAVDLSLETIQGYTSNPARIRRAIEAAAKHASSQYASSRERQRDLAARREVLDTQAGAVEVPAGGAGAGQAPGAAAGAVYAERQLGAIESRMHRSLEALERDQQGYATTNGLLAVVNSLRLLPGRKTVVFFSEGIAIPVAVQSHFRSVISEANRSNVSIYTVDAAGLRVESTVAETRREMVAAAQEQVSRLSSGRDDYAGAMMTQLERNEDLLRLNPHSGLGQLAGDTGGFLIRDTNDLETGFRRIDADMRSYYLLAYEPTNQVYDGRFRKVDVEVRRPGVEVRTRRGYYAIQQTDERPVLPFEVPALALLDGAPAPDAFPIWVRGLTFPQPARPGLAPILVDVPGNVLTFTTDEKTKTYRADLVIVARIKDPAGRVIERMSHSYGMSGPADRVAAARAGEVLFYREADLPPGRYTVETIAYDAEASAASVRSSELVVPEATEGQLRLSSVVVVKRVERVPEADRRSKPLSYGDVLLYPNLGEPVSKAAGNELTFFFTVYSARSGGERPSARIAILQKGTRLAEAPTDLPEPDASGRIQHVAGLPLAKIPAGEYELRVTVQDDRGQDARSVAFTVAE